MSQNCCNQTGSINNTTNTRSGGGFAFILVLFILVILVGAAWVN